MPNGEYKHFKLNKENLDKDDLYLVYYQSSKKHYIFVFHLYSNCYFFIRKTISEMEND